MTATPERPNRGQFVVVFHRIEDPTEAQSSTVFAAMTLLGVRVVDASLPGSVLVEGREEDVAAMLAGSTEWTYASVARLGPG